MYYFIYMFEWLFWLTEHSNFKHEAYNAEHKNW